MASTLFRRVVAGPRRNGVTSTLYSLLRRHDAFMKQLETLESDPAIDLENVTQHRYKDQPELPERLAAALRRAEKRGRMARFLVFGD